MSFVSPVWDSTNNHYVIDLVPAVRAKTRAPIGKDSMGNTGFTDQDLVQNVTENLLHALIDEGRQNKWFSKLPSHEQLLKRSTHSFHSLASESNNVATVTTLYLTPKTVTFTWMPATETVSSQSTMPPICMDDSDSNSDTADVEIPESDLPPVSLVDDTHQNHEEYLLTRLRAAKARVETEQIRMQYFEATGRMPPDSESEYEDEDE